MGRKRLFDAVQEKEKIEEEEKIEKVEKVDETKKATPTGKIISKDGEKNKQISAKVNINVYNAFTQINKIQGLSNNSALNMLITKYVRENKIILTDDTIF